MLAFLFIFRSFSVIHVVEKWMGTDWGYAVLFGLLLGCGMGVPLPEDVPLLFAGYFVRDGKMNLAVASVVAWCGIIGGDCVLYYLGRRFGLNITKVPILGRHINKDRIQWVHDRFETYGVWVVAIGRLFAGIRGAMVLTAGTIRFNIVHFLIADGIAALLSGGLFIALGYWGRKHFGNLTQIDQEVAKYKMIFGIATFSLLALWLAWQWWKGLQQKKKRAALQQQSAIRNAASGVD